MAKMKELPAQPGHLAHSKPFLGKTVDEASVQAAEIQRRVTALSRNRAVTRKLRKGEKLSPPLDWKAPK